MTPFLVASFLAYQRKTMFTQDANDVVGCANREALVDRRSVHHHATMQSIHRLPGTAIT